MVEYLDQTLLKELMNSQEVIDKGQLISEWLFCVFNFQKNQRKNLINSALEFEKWLNQTIKGPNN